MARVKLLARQSLTRGETVSIPSQLADMRTYFAGKGHTIVGEPWTSENTRGWRELDDRLDLTEAMAAADRGEYDILGIWAIDRLARKVRIIENVVWDLEQHGVALASRTEPWIDDPFLRQLAASLAEKYTRDLSARLLIAVRERTQRGHFQGRPPLGYVSREVDLLGERVKRLVVVPDEAALVTTIYAWWLDDGCSIAEIVGRLVDRGVPTRNGGRWSYQVIAHVLTNPVYLGMVRHKGVLYDGLHEAIIARERWDAAQGRFRTQAPARHRKPVSSWLEGAIEHQCGGRMYLMAEPHSVRPVTYAFFHCRFRTDPVRPCPFPPHRTRRERVEQAALACLLADLPTVRPIAEALAAGTAAAGGEDVAARRAVIDRQRQAALQRHERARERWLNGLEDQAFMAAEDTRRASVLATLEREDDALPVAPDPIDYAAAATRFADLAAALPGMDAATLGALVRAMGTAVLTDGAVTIRYHPPHDQFVPAPATVALPKKWARLSKVGGL